MGLQGFCVTLVICSCSALVVLAAEEAQQVRCENSGSVKLMNLEYIEGNTSVKGPVEVCENGVWKLLCDPNWTRYDAQVVCKSLNYSPDGKFPSKQGANFCLQLIRKNAFHSALC